MRFIAVLLIAGSSLSKNSNAVGITRLENKKASPQRHVTTKGKENAILERLLQNNQKLTNLLQYRSGEPIVWEKRAKILTGRTFRGVTLNAINSTNLSSPILVQAYPGQGLPHLTRFSCQGVTQNKRVLTLCNLMVTPETETRISAQILNLDGSSGLVGEFDDGKESLIAGAVASDFAQGMLSAAQTRISGPLGSINDASVQNQVLQGAINSGRTTSDILLEEMRTQEPVVTVEAGEEVLIYFMEAINEA